MVAGPSIRTRQSCHDNVVRCRYKVKRAEVLIRNVEPILSSFATEVSCLPKLQRIAGVFNGDAVLCLSAAATGECGSHGSE